MTIKIFKKKNGYVMLLTAVIFMLISSIVVFGLATPIVKQILLSRDIWGAKQGYYYAEAGTEDLLYRISDAIYGPNVGSQETTIFDASTVATTTISTTTNSETLQSVINSNGYEKHIQVNLKTSAGGTHISIPYAMQAGNLGITLGDMNGNGGYHSNVFGGDVYSNDDINISGGFDVVNGSVTVANPSALFVEQKNDIPSTPTASTTFGNTSAFPDFAQSFQVSTTSPLTVVSVYVKATSTPTAFTVKIVKNYHNVNYDSPSATSTDLVGTASSLIPSVTTSYQWVDAIFSPGLKLVPGNTYWIVLDYAYNSSKYYFVGVSSLDNAYASGTAKIGNLSTGSSWGNSLGIDGYFRITQGDYYGKISGTSNLSNTATTTVYAHSVSNVTVTGSLKCQVGLSNSKACDTSNPDPSPISYPISNAQIQKWEADATAGGVINGDYNPPIGSTLGPVKINGNLLFQPYGSGLQPFFLTGTVYVTGSVIIAGLYNPQMPQIHTIAGMLMSPLFGSNTGVVIADGNIQVPSAVDAGGFAGPFSGWSGAPNAFLLLISTNNSTSTVPNTKLPAIGGNYDGSYGTSTIVFAPNGMIYNFPCGNVCGPAGTAQIGLGIYDAHQTNIYYNPNIMNLNVISNVASSSSSGNYQVSDWKELTQ